MDKMREEFELAFTNFANENGAWTPDFRINKHFPDSYMQPYTEGAWWGWKASRAALCVELSDLEFSTDRSGDGGIMLSERVFDALKKAGVPYK